MQRMRVNGPTKAMGFSLVELSMVLVILGLIVGGILAGQSLIRAAELRSVITDYNRFSGAIHTFRDKYNAIPGDMSNATTYWGTAGGSGSDATCFTTGTTCSFIMAYDPPGTLP